MIVTCPSCSSRFQYDDSRFQGVPSKRFKCPKCQHVFVVENPDFQISEPEALAVSAPTPEPPQVPDQARETTARRPGAIIDAPGMRHGLPLGFRFSLAFLSGAKASTVRPLDRPRIIIGREEGDIVTLDPETSRRHAIMEIHTDGSVWLEDQNSTNGTFVEGKPITGWTQLHDRQEFTCGQSTFMILIRQDDGMAD